MSLRQLEHLVPTIRHTVVRPGIRMMDRRMGDMDRHMDRLMDRMGNHLRQMRPAMNPERNEQRSLDNTIVKDEDGNRPSRRRGFRMMDGRMGDIGRHMDRHMDRMGNYLQKMRPAMNPERNEQWSLDNTIVKDEDCNRPSRRPGVGMMDGRMGDMDRRMDRDMDRRMDRHMDSKGNYFRKMRPTIVKDKDGNRKLQLHFDVSHFKPEDIKLKVNNVQFSVQAKSKQEGEGSKILGEYFRRMTLPSEVKFDDIKSMFQDGILTVEAPLLPEEPVKQSQGVDIPIEMDSGANDPK